MRCLHTCRAGGPALGPDLDDVPVVDYVVLIVLFLACLAPILLLR